MKYRVTIQKHMQSPYSRGMDVTCSHCGTVQHLQEVEKSVARKHVAEMLRHLRKASFAKPRTATRGASWYYTTYTNVTGRIALVPVL